MTLPWLCHDFAMTLPWLCHDFAMTLPWLCHDFAMALPWLCHGVQHVQHTTLILNYSGFWLWHGKILLTSGVAQFTLRESLEIWIQLETNPLGIGRAGSASACSTTRFGSIGVGKHLKTEAQNHVEAAPTWTKKTCLILTAARKLFCLRAYAWQPGAGRETAWSQCREHAALMLRLCWRYLRPSRVGPGWAHLGPILDPCWAYVGLCWLYVGPMGLC